MPSVVVTRKTVPGSADRLLLPDEKTKRSRNPVGDGIVRDYLILCSCGQDGPFLESQTLHEAPRLTGPTTMEPPGNLGIHKSTLFRKMKTLGIPLPKEDGRSRRGG